MILLNANQFMTLPTQNPISLRAIARIQHDLVAVIPQTPLNTPSLCHSPETHLPPLLKCILYSLTYELFLECSSPRCALVSIAQLLQIFACISTFLSKPT